MARNPFRVLGVSVYSSENEIKSKYRELCKLYHPDSPKGNVEKFEQVQKAYQSIKELGFSGSSAFNLRSSKQPKRLHKNLFSIILEGGV